MKKIIPLSVLFIAIDQLIKYIIINNTTIYSSINVIDNFFKITYVTNNGAAWSLLSGNVLLLIIITIIALFLIITYLVPKNNKNILITITYSLLIGGIIGNLIDRLFRGYVVDYLDFRIIGYNFPIFNFADICIVVATILIFYTELMGVKNE